MPGSSQLVHVAAACNDGYAMALAVMLRSAACQLDRARHIVAHILVGTLSLENRERVRRSIPSDRLSLSWIEIGPAGLADIEERIRPFDWVTPETYHRVLLAEVLPSDLDKVIYLDCDVIVNRDLGELWDLEPAEALLLATTELDPTGRFVSSPHGLRRYRQLGLPAELEAFNAGVMLVNLEAWRAEHLARRVADYLAATPDDVGWHDQDALNAMVAGRWGKLDPRWNVTMHAFRRTGLLKRPSQDLREDPFAVHFNSSIKPWQSGFPFGFQELFFRHLDQTAWTGWRPRESWIRDLRGRFRRAVFKRLHSGSMALRAGRDHVAQRVAIRRRIMRIMGPPVPRARPSEVRAFILGPDVGAVLRATVASCLASGADRVILVLDEPDPGLPGLAGEPSVHWFSYPKAGSTRPQAIRALLERFGVGCWCLVLQTNERLVGAGGTPPSLAEFCARLDREGAEGMECQLVECSGSDAQVPPRGRTSSGGDPAHTGNRHERIETVLRDPVRGATFRASFDVDPSRQELRQDYVIRSKVPLLKYRSSMLLTDDLRAAGDVRLSAERGRLCSFGAPDARA